MRILIIGGNGTIGKKVSSFLSNENKIVTAGRNSGDLKIDLSAVVDRSEGFSGAELEQSVIEAMYFAFAERRELFESDLILATSQLVPLSRTAREQLESLQAWASTGRARPASLKINKLITVVFKLITIY